MFAPYIKAKLVDKGKAVKVKRVRCDEATTVTILYSLIKQVADQLGINDRQLLNHLKSLDNKINKAKKEEEKLARYGKKG
jgi:exonuclease I